jgi:phosphoglycolate phosphatase-like HAD superfamily hydrolase
MRLLLWDVDLTLLTVPGVGTRWYAEATRDVLGIDLPEVPILPGRTERGVTTELLHAAGRTADEPTIAAMFQALRRSASRDAGSFAEWGNAMPGAEYALAAFGRQAGVVQTLVTGNLEPVARLKLAAFSLEVYLDLGIGGYGDLSAHRAELVVAAMRNATRRFGRALGAKATTVIGDTPADVAAALEPGARAVAVATGRYSAEELADAGAHAVLADLTDIATVLRATL